MNPTSLGRFNICDICCNCLVTYLHASTKISGSHLKVISATPPPIPRTFGYVWRHFRLPRLVVEGFAMNS